MAQIIALSSAPNQTLTASLAINGGTVTLQLSASFNEMAGYWSMNIYDQTGNPIVCSIPLVTGAFPAANLLAPYTYLNIGSAYVINASGITSPDYANQTDLGSDFLLLWDSNEGPPGLQGNPGPAGLRGPSPTQPAGIYDLGVSGTLTPVLYRAFTQNAFLTGTATLAQPSAYNAGNSFLVVLVQDAVGGRTVSFNSFYRGLSGFVLDTTPNTYAVLWVQVDASGTFGQVVAIPMNGNSIM